MRMPRSPVAKAAAAVGVVLLLGVAASLISLLGGAGDLRGGREALLDGRKALFSGRLDEAEAAFREAQDRFDGAAGVLGGPIGWFASIVPGVGNHVDVARAVTSAGSSTAAAGVTIAGTLADLPGGLGSLAPEDGRLPIERYEEVSTVAEQAAAEARTALDTVSSAPTTWLLPAVLDARLDAEADLRTYVRTLDATERLLTGLPEFAGSGDTRRYLVLAENPAELRGTGGLWGAYTILTFRDGEASIGPSAPTQSLPRVSLDQIEAPNPDYREIYDDFGGAASWHNMNMTPDFPSAARAALGNWEAGGGEPLDGVVAADPFALREMLEATGPITIPGVDRPIGADDVVAFTTNEAYGLFTDPTLRKEVLGAVSADVLSRFLSMRGEAKLRLRAIADAASGGHLKVYATDLDLQEGFVLAGAAGDHAAGAGDVVGVHVNNGSANKVDFWAVRAVDYAVRLGGDGEAIGTLETTISNPSPTEGYPRRVLGPQVDDAGPGDQVPLISVSCHEPCDLANAERDGRPVEVGAGRELGIPWYRDYRPIAAGDEGTLRLTWKTEDAWEGNSAAGSYRLTFLGQTTIEPTEVSITVTTPPGTDVVWTSVPMEVDGDTATWRGTTGPRTEFEVWFRAPIPLRWWRSFTEAVG
jgi:hypothetical protein